MATAEEAAVPDVSPAPIAVHVEDLDIRYRVYAERHLGLADLVARGFRRRESTNVHAVRSVSFAVREGEVVGIVGRNGSGKSTLLQAIGGLIPPSLGSVLVRSDPVLLGVGAVLKPQLSGRRNIHLGCLALGLTSDEIETEMPRMERFCGLGEAMDRPMATYSAGMKARLAFAVATVRAPGILLIDEALAVGDRKFRTHSLRRIREFQAQAKAILMVTHNLNEVRSTCTRAIWLDQGKIKMDGDVESVLEAYIADEDDGSF
jgi:teichoic acid transport system ATP-binding protein